MKRSFRSWLWRVPVDQEIEEELASHVELRTRELIARGIDADSARRMATARLGDVATLKRSMRSLARKRDTRMRTSRWMDDLRTDLRFAVRQLRRSPAFTLVATATLALGIGANSAIFALVDSALLRPLPYREPDRLVTIWETAAQTARSYASPSNMLDWNRRSRTIEKSAGFVPSVGGMVMAGADGNAETVSRQWVTAGIFDVFGVQPIAGRTFTAEDETDRPNAIVLSEPFWRARFNGDRTVIGRSLRLDGTSWTVVGVMPASFQILGHTSVWAMRPLVNLPPRARAAYALQVVGRLKPGVTIDAARSDLDAVAADLAREFPRTNTGRGISVEPLHRTVVGSDLRTTAMLFFGVVGFVLLICCANVANLLLARASVRVPELAVRSALGAGRRRIVRQLLTESILLSVGGGVLGAALGAAILRTAPGLVPEGLLPPSVALVFDGRVVAFCAAAALAVGVAFGVLPAFRATRFSSAEVLAANGSRVVGGRSRLRALLVTGEVATAVVLLFGAGLLLRTLAAVDGYDRGYRASAVLSMLLDPLGSKYPTADSLQQFYDQVEAEIAGAPGVAAVGYTSVLPLDSFDDGDVTYEVAGDPPVAESQRPTTAVQAVSASYFATIDLPIVAGRAFDRADKRGAPPVCIANEAFARALGSRAAVGLRVALRPAAEPQAKPNACTIVGVARQVKKRPDEPQPFVQLYLPLAQDLSDDVYLVVRPRSGPAEALTGAVRAAISRIDTEQLVSVREIRTLADIGRAATARQRFRATLVVAFAGLALVLAMVGVFGILSYSVQQHARDFGLRRALGASTADIVFQIGGDAARVVGAGAVIGLALAAAGGRVIETLLVGVTPLDTATFALVSGVLAITALCSIAAPAWRASRVDPATALRTQ